MESKTDAMHMESSQASLATLDFWDQFWVRTKLPCLPDPRRSYQRCFIRLFEKYFPTVASCSAFEVGCAPGMWLAYLHKQFGYQVFGCDTSARGVALTKENFRLCGVPGEVTEHDFLEYRKGPFDVMVSIGFIEHFEAPQEVLEQHVRLLKPGGLLLLAVPNFRGLNEWLTSQDLLSVHNLSVMRKSFFRAFARDAELETVFLDYAGGFEPDNLILKSGSISRKAVFFALRVLRRFPGAQRLNSRYFSGFLIGVFRKQVGRS